MFMLSLISWYCLVCLHGSESLHSFLLILFVCLFVCFFVFVLLLLLLVCYLTRHILYISYCRIWISNAICRGLFCVQWFEVICGCSCCWYWWISRSMLSIIEGGELYYRTLLFNFLSNTCISFMLWIRKSTTKQ
jgi:hypothetical protein